MKNPGMKIALVSARPSWRHAADPVSPFPLWDREETETGNATAVLLSSRLIKAFSQAHPRSRRHSLARRGERRAAERDGLSIRWWARASPHLTAKYARISAADNTTLKAVELPVRTQLEARKTRVENVYFLNPGLASVVANGGHPIEVGMIGREGGPRAQTVDPAQRGDPVVETVGKLLNIPAARQRLVGNRVYDAEQIARAVMEFADEHVLPFQGAVQVMHVGRCSHPFQRPLVFGESRPASPKPAILTICRAASTMLDIEGTGALRLMPSLKRQFAVSGMNSFQPPMAHALLQCKTRRSERQTSCGKFLTRLRKRCSLWRSVTAACRSRVRSRMI
jgi:hypothetical protein